MKLSNPALSLIAAALAVLLWLPPAWAGMISSKRSPGQASGSGPAAVEAKGKIDRVDLASNTLVVDSVAYLFAGASVIVHSSDPAVNGNALKLRKGERIRFTVRKEAGATRGRITEIWVLEDMAPAPKAK